MSWSNRGQIVLMAGLLVIGSLASATMAQAQIRDPRLSDPAEPGSVIVFPKFIRGTVVVDCVVTPRTEVAVGVVCPKGVICPEGQKVKIRFHWVCGTDENPNTSFICQETNFEAVTTVNGKLVFNTEGTTAPGNFVAPFPPCQRGYLIGWVEDTSDRPIKFDGLIGDVVLRESGTAVAAYNGITIQAHPTLANGALIALGGPNSDAPVFDGAAGHYQAVTGVIYGDVAYDKPDLPRRSTFLTLLTLDVRSNLPNLPTFVHLDFYNSQEGLLSTFTEFVCWEEVQLSQINGNLTSVGMGSRKGVVVSRPAVKQAIGGILGDTAGPVTLLGLVDTLEGPVVGNERMYIHGLLNDSKVPTVAVPTGSCQPSSSLSVLVTGTNVVSYVPKGNWGSSTTGVSAVNVEGSSVTNTLISTPNVVNSCASNPLTGRTVCTANNTDVYLLTGTTLSSTLTSGGSGTISFSGGTCTNCGVTMDATHNKAVIGLSLGGVGGFQYLNLGGSPAFEPAFASRAPGSQISEDILIDPIRNLLLSPAENNNFEIINVATTTSPAFFEHAVPGAGGILDSAGEDCSTGIALAPAEFSSTVFIADLTQATFTPGSPGTWSAPSQVQTLSEAVLSAGASGIAVAQGTHTGIVTGEFGGDAITAIALPTTSGTGTPAISDWVTCSIGGGFSMGFDPHTVTAYQSPNGGDAIGLLANSGATTLAVVDLTKMLNPTIVPRTVGGHGCASGTLPATVVSFIAVP